MENLATMSDRQLVALYAEGNYEAFDILLERNQGKLFEFILYMTGGDEDRANDVFQDTFVKAIVAIRNGRYTETGQFSSWLVRIARNLVMDDKRNQKSRATVSHEITNAQGDLCRDLLNRSELCEANIEDHMVEEQAYTDVRTLINALPATLREVVVMRYYEDKSFKEIAAATGVSINTALGRMRYGLINLRRMAAARGITL